MTPFDPILPTTSSASKLLEAARRDMEDQMVVMAMERKHAATREAWEESLAQQVVYQIEQKKRDEEWEAHHELAMKEFDNKLNGLIAWLDDFVKRNPKNGK